jgi:hypothetical protein
MQLSTASHARTAKPPEYTTSEPSSNARAIVCAGPDEPLMCSMRCRMDCVVPCKSISKYDTPNPRGVSGNGKTLDLLRRCTHRDRGSGAAERVGAYPPRRGRLASCHRAQCFLLHRCIARQQQEADGSSSCLRAQQRNHGRRRGRSCRHDRAPTPPRPPRPVQASSLVARAAGS